jgi:hypothetical protein
MAPDDRRPSSTTQVLLGQITVPTGAASRGRHRHSARKWQQWQQNSCLNP